MRQLFESFAGFDDFLVYLAVSIALLGLFIAIYIRITPYREIAADPRGQHGGLVQPLGRDARIRRAARLGGAAQREPRRHGGLGR